MIKKYLLISTMTLGLLTGCSSVFSQDEEDQPKGVYYIGEPYSIKGVLYTPQEDMAYSEKGFATWYTRPEEDRLTTNGELFDDEELTAAHKTLPLPSLVRITNLDNGNTAIVRVNDRGPAVNNRLIDVSKKAAEALELPENGTTMVQVDILPFQSRRLKSKLKPYTEVKEKEQDNVTVIPVGSDAPIYQEEDGSLTSIYSEKKTTEQLPEVKEKKVDVKPIPSGNWMVQVGVYGQQANADRAIKTVETIATSVTQKQGKLTVVMAGPFGSKAEAKVALEQLKQAGYQDGWIKAIK